MKLFRFTTIVAIVATCGFANAETLYYVDDNGKFLKTVDTNSLATNTIGALGAGGNFGDMAYDHRNGVMYYVGGRGDNNLYTLNLNTGAATLIGNHQINDLFALGWDPVSGNLFAQDSSSGFWMINKLTAGATSMGSNSVYPGGLTYNFTSGMMVLSEAGGSGGFYSINLGTGAATLLANSAWRNDNDAVHSSASNTYFSMDWSGNLYAIDSGYNQTTLGTGFGSVASVEIVPEPATMAILGLGALALARRRRKK